MMVQNHNQALDAHTAILSSLTPMNAQNKSLRASLLVSLIMSRLDEKQLNEINTRNKTSDGWDYLNSIIGEGTMDDELEGFIETELIAMRDAQTIFCTSEILDEIQEAQTTMLDDILLPQDVFVPNGFMVLEKPYKYVNTVKWEENLWQREHWEVQSIMFWNTENRKKDAGFGVTLYGHWRGVDFFEQQDMPTNQKPDASFVYNPDTGKTDVLISGEMADSNTTHMVRRLESVHSKQHQNRATGTPMFIDCTFYQYGETGTDYDLAILELKRFLLAFFRLTYEYIDVNPIKTERHFHKRAQRVGKTIPDNGYITVMSLRRKMYADSEEFTKRDGPAYAFRVRGHWRKAYMRSRNLPVGNPGAYRHIYIKDYIKGRGVVVNSKRVVKVGD
jgi:hypothetical protein